jgi:hypothetical protein
MSLVFQNIDPPPPSPPGECAFVGEEDTGICYLGDKPHSPNLSDLSECVILCTSWLQSPWKSLLPNGKHLSDAG